MIEGCYKLMTILTGEFQNDDKTCMACYCTYCSLSWPLPLPLPPSWFTQNQCQSHALTRVPPQPTPPWDMGHPGATSLLIFLYTCYWGTSTSSQWVTHKHTAQQQCEQFKVHNLPLCSPRKTSLNFLSGFPNSPDMDMLLSCVMR